MNGNMEHCTKVHHQREEDKVSKRNKILGLVAVKLSFKELEVFTVEDKRDLQSWTTLESSLNGN